MKRLRLVGPGRAGRSLAAALADVGYEVVGLLGRGDDVTGAARGVDALVIATPDSVVPEVAAAVEPDPGAAVLHLSGALDLHALAPHPRRASLHPLIPLPDPEAGALRLRSGITFAVAGDPIAAELARMLGGRSVTVPDERRAVYHATACVAANHLVALLGQVERLAALSGMDLDDFLPLATRRAGRRRGAGPGACPHRSGGTRRPRHHRPPPAGAPRRGAGRLRRADGPRPAPGRHAVGAPA